MSKKCPFLQSIVNKRYASLSPAELRNFSISVFETPIPPDYYVVVPCGKCPVCLKKKALTWRHRLVRELPLYNNSVFVTLSIKPSYYKKFCDSPEEFVRRFLDNLRKVRIKDKGKSVRHWFTTEGGSSPYDVHRYHIHGFLFGITKKDLPFKLIRRAWRYGFCWLNNVQSTAAATYVSKYLTKDYNFSCKIFTSPHVGDDMIKDLHYDDNLGRYESFLNVPHTFYCLPVPPHYARRLEDSTTVVKHLRNRYKANLIRSPLCAPDGTLLTIQEYRQNSLNEALRYMTRYPIIVEWILKSNYRIKQYNYYLQHLL